MATDLGKINEAINAYHRVLDLNKTFSSAEVLHKLAKMAIKDPDAYEENVLVLDKLTKLFGRVTATVNTLSTYSDLMCSLKIGMFYS